MGEVAKLSEYSYRLTGELFNLLRIWNPDRVERYVFITNRVKPAEFALVRTIFCPDINLPGAKIWYRRKPENPIENTIGKSLIGRWLKGSNI